MNNIYPLRQYSTHQPVQTACRIFWRAYLAVVVIAAVIYFI